MVWRLRVSFFAASALTCTSVVIGFFHGFFCHSIYRSRPSIIWREVETALALGLMVAFIPRMRSWLKKI